jgi:hypothetical protein
MIVVRRSAHGPRMVTESTSNGIIPSLRDGLFFGVIPGSKLPGYAHKVPPGQKRFVLSWPTQSRDWETTSACVLHVLSPIGQHALNKQRSSEVFLLLVRNLFLTPGPAQ